jgi:hypothetical protein
LLTHDNNPRTADGRCDHADKLAARVVTRTVQPFDRPGMAKTRRLFRREEFIE